VTFKKGQNSAGVPLLRNRVAVATVTLRDYFAAAVLCDLEAGTRDNMDGHWWHPAERIALRAYSIADWMIKVRAMPEDELKLRKSL
jgi:hypothetical protein